MIHVFLGTKAQYIKTGPLLRLMDRRGIGYNLIDSGQHAGLGDALREELGLRRPDVFLRQGEDIATLPQAARWLARTLAWAARRPRRMFAEVFRSRDGVCVVHGDTPTTLLAVLLARLARLRIAHIEGGLRSYNYGNPFPEELIRVVAMRMADLVFAPSDWAFANLRRMGLSARLHNLGANTNVEALAYSLRRQADSFPTPARYALFLVHRVETLHSRKRMRAVVDCLRRVAESRPALFVLHRPTELILRKYGLEEELRRCPGVTLLPLQAHGRFLHLLRGADFVVTDGGSIQEESHYLGVPCLLLRKRTERQDGLGAITRARRPRSSQLRRPTEPQEGLGANVCLSGFEERRIAYFLGHWNEYRAGSPALDSAPSEKILAAIAAYA